MKLTYLILALFLFSCKSQFPIAYNPLEAKNPKYDSYLKTKDGKILTGPSISKENQNKIFKPTLFKIGDTTLKAKEVDEYQDASGLYKRIAGQLTMAMTGPRIRVYRQLYETTQTSYTGGFAHTSTSTSTVYYIQNAKEDKVYRVGLSSTKPMAEWTEDNAEANEQAILARNMAGKIKLHRLISWGAILGGIVMISSDPALKQKAGANASGGALLYTGSAFFFGGIVDLVINVIHRRGKTGRAYAEAIRIYNSKK